MNPACYGFLIQLDQTTSDSRKTPPAIPIDGAFLCVQIGAPGFEPGTSCSQSRRATGLRHTPL